MSKIDNNLNVVQKTSKRGLEIDLITNTATIDIRSDQDLLFLLQNTHFMLEKKTKIMQWFASTASESLFIPV